MADELRAITYHVQPLEDGMPWGWIGLVSSPRGLRYLHLPLADREVVVRNMRRHYPDVVLALEEPFLDSTALQVQDYLLGNLETFDVELDLRGYTTFELSVWSITGRIPYGETRTYGWIASQLQSGNAQAVGNALATNPVPLIVPCHRVIGADGSLHGFLGGLEMKARLLALETHQLALPL